MHRITHTHTHTHAHTRMSIHTSGVSGAWWKRIEESFDTWCGGGFVDSATHAARLPYDAAPMGVCVCVFVCVCVCLYIFIYTYIYLIHICILRHSNKCSLYVCNKQPHTLWVFVCVCLCVCLCTFIHIYKLAYIWYIDVYSDIRINVPFTFVINNLIPYM